jgi:hypothetical protein
VSFKIPNGPDIKLSSSDASKTFTALFAAFLAAYHDLLNPFQRGVYNQILTSEKPPIVSNIIPDFDRENKDHIGCLRALRGIGLIAPGDGGPWRADSRIVLTDFGRLLNTYLKDHWGRPA